MSSSQINEITHHRFVFDKAVSLVLHNRVVEPRISQAVLGAGSVRTANLQNR
jgi:hypothetical protein